MIFGHVLVICVQLSMVSEILLSLSSIADSFGNKDVVSKPKLTRRFLDMDKCFSVLVMYVRFGMTLS